MDANHANVLTLDEYNKYLQKVDIFNAKSAVKNEKAKRLQENIFDFEIEKFINESEEEKKQSIKPLLDKVQNFYSDLPYIEYEDIKEKFELLSKKITPDEIEIKFNDGLIFLDDFRNLLYEHMPNLTEEDMNKIFAYFDQNNMNLFIYVRDFIKYFKPKENEEPNPNINTSRQFRRKMMKEQFLLVYIGIMKKLLKLCIMELGLSPYNFSDKFILTRKYEKNIIILNYLQTEMAVEKLRNKVTNFLPIEDKILFSYYIDYYNYGILFTEDLKLRFDNMMKYINDSDIYDLTRFDTFDLENANPPASRAIVKNGIVGMPGTNPIKPSKPETTPRTLGSENISFLISCERDSSFPEARDTIKPVAVEISNAGICETRPSPTVNIV